MKKIAPTISVAAAALLSGCASSSISYMPPSNHQSAITKTIEKPRDAVWADSVPALGKDFFVINNLDKASGLINVSYSGDPHDYVDCGHINASFENLSGRRDYSFDGSVKDTTYALYKYPILVNFRRQMNLDGRVNIIFEAVGPTETRVTVNARYVVQRQLNARASNGQTGAQADSVAFSSRGHAAFSEAGGGSTARTECVPTGKLEQEILSLIQ